MYVFSMLQAASFYTPTTQTQWSMAYDVRARRYYWKTQTNSNVRYFDIRDFDFSCGTNVEVLDVNSSDSGNVRATFVPYTTDFNRDLVRRTYVLYNRCGSYTACAVALPLSTTELMAVQLLPLSAETKISVTFVHESPGLPTTFRYSSQIFLSKGPGNGP